MAQILVDGRPYAVRERAGTYAELLAALDPAMAMESRVVTAIRVDGVEEPAFREASVGHCDLPGARVDVETRTVRELATAALADAARLMPAVRDAAGQIGEQVRLTSAPAEAMALSDLAEGLTLLVTLVQAADAWADAAGWPDRQWLGDHVVRVAEGIDSLNESQRDGDWVSVADVLSYDLAPALDRWQQALASALEQLPRPAVAHAVPSGAAADHA